MAIKHLAYSIRLRQSHQDLNDMLTESDVIALSKLRNVARKSISMATVDDLHKLNELGYDESWLDDDSPYLWYMAYLTDWMKEVPSLGSGRIHGSWYVLQVALPAISWSKDDAEECVFGKPIREFLRVFNRGLLYDHFKSAFWGYIKQDQAEIYLGTIKKDRAALLGLEKSLPAELFDYAEVNEIEPNDVLERAFLDAYNMLESSLARQEDLMIVFRT